MSDEELLATKGNGGASEVLCERYIKNVSALCRQFLKPSDHRFDDLLAEGLMALLSAINSYDPSRGASFRTYASVCVKNRLSTCVKQRIEPTDTDRSVPSPEHIYIERETDERFWQGVQEKLSELELSVLTMRIDDYSYAQIADKLNITEKSAENAMSRVRNKLRSHMTE
jgi:RNA polymerase sporulation-specific sigma factor